MEPAAPTPAAVRPSEPLLTLRTPVKVLEPEAGARTQTPPSCLATVVVPPSLARTDVTMFRSVLTPRSSRVRLPVPVKPVTAALLLSSWVSTIGPEPLDSMRRVPVVPPM